MTGTERMHDTASFSVARPEVGTLVVEGADRLSWLQGLVTCDVASLEPSRARWGLALTKPGKVLAELWVLGTAEHCILGVAGGDTEGLAEWLDGFIVMEDVDLSDASEGFAWATLHGPGSEKAARALAETHPGVHAGGLDWTGQGGAILAVPKADLESALAKVEAYGFPRISQADWEAFRIGSLLPSFGRDYDAGRNPHEASLDRRAVSWTKGCYLGQEAVYMQDVRGKVKRRLVTLAIRGESSPGTPVFDSETREAIGSLTSVTKGPRGEALGIASVRARYAELGARLMVGENEARVVVTPPSS